MNIQKRELWVDLFRPISQVFSYVGPDMKTKKKYHVDTVSLNFPKKDMEVSRTT